MFGIHWKEEVEDRVSGYMGLSEEVHGFFREY